LHTDITAAARALNHINSACNMSHGQFDIGERDWTVAALCSSAAATPAVSHMKILRIALMVNP